MKYLVTTPIKFGGKRREEGSALDLSDEQAAPLLASGALKPARNLQAEKAAADKAAAEKTAAEKAAAEKAAAEKAAAEKAAAEKAAADKAGKGG
jgi:membrane protein involved in colicin uptake